MNKIIIAIVVVAVVLVGGYFLLHGNPKGISNPVSAPTNLPTQTSQPSPTPTPTPTTSASAPKTWTVAIQDFAFHQPSLTIKKGDTVIWTNKDSAPHTVTVDSDGGPASPTLNTNGTYSFIFNTAGTFSYHCSFHPSMHGAVVVTQ